MEYFKLNNGVQIPSIGYGVYQIPKEDTKRCVLEALEIGYRLIDTAQYYENERGVGDAIKASNIPREEIYITTKLKSNDDVEKLINESLTELQTNYIDLLLIHWVMGDDIMTWKKMENAVRTGKVRSIGLSNFYGDSYETIVNNATILPAVNQIEHHVLRQNDSFRPILKKTDTYLEAWAPFAEGKAELFQNRTLKKISISHKKTIAQIMLRFYIQSDVIAIPKSIHKSRMAENFDIFDFSLSKQDMKVLQSLNQELDLFGWYQS